MSRKLSLLAAAFAALGLAHPSYAYDTDQKAYPGTFCQQGGTSQALWYYHGRVINTSTATRVADCPIVTDSSIGIARGRVRAFVVDRHYSRDFSCTIHVYNENSPSPQYNWSNRRSSGSSESVQVLDFDFTSSTITTWPFGPAMLGCEIPGDYSGNRSELVSYHVWDTTADQDNLRSSD